MAEMPCYLDVTDVNAVVSKILLLVARGCAIEVVLTILILPSLQQCLISLYRVNHPRPKG